MIIEINIGLRSLIRENVFFYNNTIPSGLQYRWGNKNADLNFVLTLKGCYDYRNQYWTIENPEGVV